LIKSFNVFNALKERDRNEDVLNSKIG
jgi:hypothetical protein